MRTQKAILSFITILARPKFNEKTIIWKHESLLWKHDTLLGHHVLQRGAAGGAAGTTRDRHADILTCATVTRARARRSRARLSALAGRVRLRGRANLIFFSTLEKQENEYADTCYAGAVRPRVALFAWRVRELCTRRVVTKPCAAQTLRVVGVNRAHGADLGEDAAKGRVTCCFLILFLWAFSQTTSSCFHKRDSCFQIQLGIVDLAPVLPTGTHCEQPGRRV
jgi:hypothetical protein